MPNIVVVGTQWGDEGKGKVVDLLAPHVNVVARYAGGNNAGHTVVVGREKYVLPSIPSAILHSGCRCVIGCGVVVDPGSLIEEMEALVRRGVTLDGNLFISKNAHLIMPYHPALDLASEAKLGKRRIGTTGRGVGPAYVDKTARVGIRMADLLNERLFREKLELNVAQKNRLLREIYDAETFTVEEILDKYLRYAGWLAPYITDTALLLSRWMESGYSVLFEGAQATMLDIDHGTYPYITSSSTTAGGAATGTGVPPTRIHGVLGVSKAYTTRVGAGPFPSEMSGPLAEAIRARGHEYGSTTGRPRRCGWFDAVVGRHARRVNGRDPVRRAAAAALLSLGPVQPRLACRRHGPIGCSSSSGASAERSTTRFDAPLRTTTPCRSSSTVACGSVAGAGPPGARPSAVGASAAPSARSTPSSARVAMRSSAC